MKVVTIIQARMTSSRLPGKIFMEVVNKTLLEINLQRIAKAKKIGSIILATTDLPSDDKTQMVGESLGFKVYRGDENDVLDRFYQAVQSSKANPDYVVRLTADCPLIDASLIDKIIDYSLKNRLDYCSNTLEPMYPDGQDVEVFKFKCLKKAWREAKLQSEREHVTPYIWKNSSFNGGNIFHSENYSDTDEDFSTIRMTVDEEADYQVIKNIILNLGLEKTWLEYAHYLQNEEKVRNLNANNSRNQGYEKSIRQDIEK